MQITKIPAWLGIVLTALVIRTGLLLVVAPYPERLVHRDSSGYIQIANNLVDGHGFSQDTTPPYEPDAFRTPVYPLFIALIFGLWGENIGVVVGIQVLISSLTVVLTYILGCLLFTRNQALIGAGLMAFSLGSVVYSIYILTETLFTFLIVVVFLSLASYGRQLRKGWLVLTGLTSGLAILCRPMAIFLPLVCLIFIGWVHRRQAVIPGVILFLTTALVIIPWVVRNTLQVGITTISTVSAYNALFYNAVALDADLLGVSQVEARVIWQARWQEILANSPQASPEVEVQLMRSFSRELILAHPWRYAYIHLRNDLNALIPNGTEMMELLGITSGAKGTLSVLNQEGLAAAVRHYFGDRTWLVWVFSPVVLLLGLVYGGALMGGVSLAKGRDWGALILLALPVFFLLVIPGPASHPRFRVPAMPMVNLLAGWGWAQAAGVLKKRRVQS